VFGSEVGAEVGWAFGVALGECIKECRFGSTMCSCCDGLRRLDGLRSGAEEGYQEGKRVARSGSDRSDGDGGRSAQTLFVGNWEGDGETETERAEME